LKDVVKESLSTGFAIQDEGKGYLSDN